MHDGMDFLIMANHHTGWLMVKKVTSTSNESVTKKLHGWFADLSVPMYLTSNTGPQYRSSGFTTLCELWGIWLNPSSAYYPQSNGHAEQGYGEEHQEPGEQDS